MLSLQQCLTVCRHYESLSLHIQQIRSGADKQVEFLRKCHPKSKRSGPNKPQQKGQNLQKFPQPPLSQQKFTKPQKKCYGCGHELHKDGSKNCPAWGLTCRKCNKLNHWEIVCGQIPKKSSQRRPSDCSMVSEVRNSASSSQTIPKQVFDIVNVANSVDNLSHNYKRQLELNTLMSQSNTQSFSNIQNGQPVIFISQALTDTQKWYSNIERELLAIVVVIKKRHHYIFGRHFAVHTDHSPLVNLFEKCLNDTSPHLQRLMLRLSQYQMHVKYITQKCVPIVDCMSWLINSKTGVEDPTLNLQIADVTKTNVNWDQIKLSCLMIQQ